MPGTSRRCVSFLSIVFVGAFAVSSPPVHAEPAKPLVLPVDGLVVGGSQLVTAGGAVGVGTATPAGLLDVSSPVVGETLDQQQTFASGNRGGATTVWQSFTPASDGSLTRIDCKLGAIGAWTGTLNLYEGEGTTGTLLGSQQVGASGNAWQSFVLSNPVKVQAGKRYTFQFTQLTGMSVAMTSSNPYSDGRNDYLSYSDYLFKTYTITTRKVVVTGTGRLGVGTAEPDQLLTVAGNGRVTGILDVGSRIDAQGGANLRGAPGGTGLHVDRSGNVGVGTTAPANRLDVHGPAQLRGAADKDGLFVAPSGNVGVGTTTPGSALTVAGATTISGDLGIGTTTPARRLDVNGAARVTGALEVTGNVNAGATTVSTLTAGTLAVGGAVTVAGVKPVLIKRMENIGNDANVNTGISAVDYHCVAAGWSVAYDVQENGSTINMVWTYVSGSSWWVRTQFGSHDGSHENPDVDVLCFHTAVSKFEGNRALNQPN